MTTSVLAAKSPGPLAGVVNGPEDACLDWPLIGWRQVGDDVRRLRQRIFTAKEQDLRRVRSLQKLMLGSRSNALWSVRRVTEVNTGRKTAGVDGLIVVSQSQKAELAHAIRGSSARLTSLPVKRVYIPKAGGKQRPLGIPTDLANREVS